MSGTKSILAAQRTPRPHLRRKFLTAPVPDSGRKPPADLAEAQTRAKVLLERRALAANEAWDAPLKERSADVAEECCLALGPPSVGT